MTSVTRRKKLHSRANNARYGIVVAGCGCCGSPFLKNATDDAYEYNGTDIRWIKSIFSLGSNQVLHQDMKLN